MVACDPRVPFAAMGDEVLRGVTFADGSTGDVRLRGGRIAAVGDVGRRPDDDEHDLAGHVLLTAAVEPHAHLDKAFLAERLANPSGDLLGAIAAMIESRALLDVADIVERAERAARLMARNGFRAVRTHADTTLDNGLCQRRGARRGPSPRRRRDRRRDRRPVRWPITGPAGADQRALLGTRWRPGPTSSAVARTSTAAGTRAATETFLAIAADHGVGVDLHTDETLDASCEGLADLAAARRRDRVRPAGDRQPLRQPRDAVAGTAAGDGRGGRRRRHRRRRPAGDQPLPPGARPSSRRRPAG